MEALQGPKDFQYLEEPDEEQNNEKRDFSKKQLRMTFSFMGFNAFVFALILFSKATAHIWLKNRKKRP